MTLIARDATYHGDPRHPPVPRTVYRYDDELDVYPLDCEGCGQSITGPEDRCEHADDIAVHYDPDCCSGCRWEANQHDETLRSLPR